MRTARMFSFLRTSRNTDERPSGASIARSVVSMTGSYPSRDIGRDIIDPAGRPHRRRKGIRKRPQEFHDLDQVLLPGAMRNMVNPRVNNDMLVRYPHAVGDGDEHPRAPQHLIGVARFEGSLTSRITSALNLAASVSISATLFSSSET